MQRYLVPLLISVVLAIGLYGVTMLFSNVDQTLSSIQKLPLSGWALVISLSLMNYILRFIRWEGYIEECSGKSVPRLQHFGIYISGFALTTTPGKAGEAIRSLYLQRYGVRLTHSLSTMFVERLVDFISMVLLSIVVAVQFKEYSLMLLIIGVILLTALPLIHYEPFLNFIARTGERLPEKFSRLTNHLMELIRSSLNLLKNKYLYGGLIIGVIAWGAEGTAFYYTLNSLDIDASIFLAISIYAIAVLIGALSFIPGGLGSTEAVMGFLLTAIGADLPSAVAATLICRMATLWFAVVVGFISMGTLALKNIMPVVVVKGES